MRRLLVLTIVVLFVGVAGLYAFAPYLAALVLEGSPSLTWRDVGQYAEVKGASPPSVIGTTSATELEQTLDAMFTESGGRALLAAQNGAIMLEHYSPGTNSVTRLNSFSIAKSLTGALIFKALARRGLRALIKPLASCCPRRGG